MRRDAGLPPFGRLAAAIVVSGPDRAATEAYARELARAACLRAERRAGAWLRPAVRARTILVLGPAEAPHRHAARKHRFRLLAKAPRRADLQGFLRRDAGAGAQAARAACASPSTSIRRIFSMSFLGDSICKLSQSLTFAASLRVARGGTLCYVSRAFRGDRLRHSPFPASSALEDDAAFHAGPFEGGWSSDPKGAFPRG